jgi:hypothetical protein
MSNSPAELTDIIYKSDTCKVTVSTSLPKINCGNGPAVGGFLTDRMFSGGTALSYTNKIDTLAPNAAPAKVYQSERYNNFNYKITGLAKNTNYAVRLHFVEHYWTAIGKRVYNVKINTLQVLTCFDIFKEAPGQNKALVRNFPATSNDAGEILIEFINITGKDNAQVCGIEILPGSSILKSGKISTDISGTEINENLQLYPNPAQGIINLKGLKPGIYSVRVSDVVGHNMLSTKLTVKNTAEETNLEINKLNKGFYQLHIIDENGKWLTKSFVKN